MAPEPLRAWTSSRAHCGRATRPAASRKRTPGKCPPRSRKPVGASGRWIGRQSARQPSRERLRTSRPGAAAASRLIGSPHELGADGWPTLARCRLRWIVASQWGNGPCSESSRTRCGSGDFARCRSRPSQLGPAYASPWRAPRSGWRRATDCSSSRSAAGGAVRACRTFCGYYPASGRRGLRSGGDPPPCTFVNPTKTGV
jgi:hypothetical protein